jgi:hypothetical protein
MLHRLKTLAGSWQHRLRCGAIEQTPPLAIQQAPLVILSLVSHADLIMYLVAVKSLYRRIRLGRIVVMDDGTLKPRDLGALAYHLGSPQVIQLADVRRGPCPSGGCWERLLAIVDLSAHNYVIQLDSDTLARADLDEMIACYRANRAFTLGTRLGQSLSPLSEAPDRIRMASGDQVQLVAERSLPRLQHSENLRYVRGSAALAGFARGACSRRAVEEFSAAMRGLIGAKWDEWGSEQVTSNFLVANSPEAEVLPYPKYASFDMQMDPARSVFLHFIGTHRFSGGVYVRESARLVSELRRAETA